MKKALGILFSLIVIAPLLSKTLVFVWFAANQTEIAQTLCINKNNEERQDCKGCCILNDKLKQVDNESTPPADSPKQKENKAQQEFQWVNGLNPNQLNIYYQFPELHLYTSYIQNLEDQYQVEISKPPCLI